MRNLSWHDVRASVDRMADYWAGQLHVTNIYGVPTGGCFVALLPAHKLDLPMVDEPRTGTLVVDDLIDSGRTLIPYIDNGFIVDVLYKKPHSPSLHLHQVEIIDGWIKFPWEHDTGPLDALVRLLQFLDWPNKSVESAARSLLVRLQSKDDREAAARLVADLTVRGIP